jgi:hypothetical protein
VERAPRTLMRTQLSRAEVPGSIAQIVMTALSVDPAKRYADADALADAIEQAARKREVTALKREIGFPVPPKRIEPTEIEEDDRPEVKPKPAYQISSAGIVLRMIILLSMFVLGWCSAAG